MDLNKLAVLKQHLVKAPKLADAYKYFLDHFGDDPAFMEVGQRTTEPLLDKFVEAIGQQLFGPRAKIASLLLVRIAEHHFIHGACMINGRMANVLYFDDIQAGMVAIVPGKPGEATQFARFSGRQLPDGYVGSDN